MGKKKNRNGGGEMRNENQENQNNNQQHQEKDNQQKEENNDKQKEETKKNDGGGKKDDTPLLAVVLKIEVHCEGCATKIKKTVRGFKGVESVKTELESNKVTVVGRVDPAKLREFVEQKMKRKVEQLSPAPKKDKDNNNNKDGNGGGEKKKAEEKKTEEKKPKEQPVTTAVMKVNLHCQGCIQKIRKTITHTKGFHDLSIDEQKNQVTVKGAIDMKALAETLKEKMKKPVEIVPPKKEGGEKKDGGGEGNKEKGGDGNGGEKKQKGGGGGQGGKCGGEGDEFRVGYIQCGYANQCVNGYGFGFGYPVANFHEPAPQIFSDENPNACSIM